MKAIKKIMHLHVLHVGAMLLVASLFYMYEFMLRVLPSPMFSHLMKDFDIDASNLAILSSSYLLAYALMQLFAGLSVDKFGPRRLLTFATLVCAVSTLIFAHTETFVLVCVARFFIGFGSAFAFICCMKIATLWLPARHFPLITGLTLTLGTLGAVIGQGPVAALLERHHWRDIMSGIGLVGVGLALLAYLLVRDHNPHRPQQQMAESTRLISCLKKVVGKRQNWLIAAYAMLVTGPTDAFGGMWEVPFLVQTKLFTLSEANLASSMVFVGMAVGSPVFGILSNGLKRRKPPIMLGAWLSAVFLGLILFLPAQTGVMSAVLSFFYGFSSTYVLAFVMIKEQVDPMYVGTAVGFVNFASMIGSTVLTSSTGFILHAFGSHAVVDGMKIYESDAYLTGLVPLLVFYVICACCIIPFIKETFRQQA